MRIAEIVPEMLPVPPSMGGAVETWVFEVSKRMPKRHQIYVYSRPGGTEQNDNIRYVGIPWRRMDRLCYRIKARLEKPNPLRTLAKMQNVWFYGRAVAAGLNDDMDVIHIHNEPNLVPMLKRKAGGAKVVLHMHNDHLVNLRALRRRYAAMLRELDSIVCVSNYIRAEIVRLFPAVEGKTFTISNGADTGRFRPYGEMVHSGIRSRLGVGRAPLILYVGRITPEKGLHVLLKALRRVVEKMPSNPPHLVIAGTSFFKGAGKTSYTDRISRLAETLKDKIVFTGYLSGSVLHHLYSAADLFVFPPIWNEPSGLVLFEAMASGTAVISSRVGGTGELIRDGHSGLLVPPGDEAQLADAILELLNDEKKRDFLSMNAYREVLAKGDWQCVADNLHNHLEETLQ